MKGGHRKRDKSEIFTFLLIADEDLEGDGRLHFHRHLVVIDQTQASELEGCLQVLVTLELDLAEVMKHPAGLEAELPWRQTSRQFAPLKIELFFNNARVSEHISHPGSHVTQLTAEQRKDMILQHELHLVFVDLPLIEKIKIINTTTQEAALVILGWIENDFIV